MFQVLPEPEFSAWFEALPEPLAEEVAAAVDLAATASAGLAPERLSRLLLWFDGTGSGSGRALDGLAFLPHALRREGAAEQLRSYLTWHQEVLACLQAASFRRRLEQLPPAPAAQALARVERLRRRLQAARVSASHAVWSKPGGAERDALGLRAEFEALLALVGLDAQRVLGSGSGLRELCIDNVSPQLRVLFGLDFPARKLLAISGESLTGRYYGDSVRHAEQRWQAYLARSSAPHEEVIR
jgi:hypothetical protein